MCQKIINSLDKSRDDTDSVPWQYDLLTLLILRWVLCQCGFPLARALGKVIAGVTEAVPGVAFTLHSWTCLELWLLWFMLVSARKSVKHCWHYPPQLWWDSCFGIWDETEVGCYWNFFLIMQLCHRLLHVVQECSCDYQLYTYDHNSSGFNCVSWHFISYKLTEREMCVHTRPSDTCDWNMILFLTDIRRQYYFWIWVRSTKTSIIRKRIVMCIPYKRMK